MTANTQVSICNLALGHLAMKPITSISDTSSPEAIECNRFWNPALRETLRGNDWPFAKAILSLVQPDDASAWVTSHAYLVGDYVTNSTNTYRCLVAHTSGTFATDLAAAKWVLHSLYVPLLYEYCYAFPQNVVAVRKVYDEGYNITDNPKGEVFEELYDPINGVKVIVTNVDDAYAEVTYLVEDVTLFDETFVTAFAYRLAADLAIPLTASQDNAKAMIDGFKQSISDAQRMASYDSNPQAGTPNQYVKARA